MGTLWRPPSAHRHRRWRLAADYQRSTCTRLSARHPMFGENFRYFWFTSKMVKPTPIFSNVLTGDSGLTSKQWSDSVYEVATGFVASLKHDQSDGMIKVSGVCLSRAKNNVWYAVNCAWRRRDEFKSLVFAEYKCGCATTCVSLSPTARRDRVRVLLRIT